VALRVAVYSLLLKIASDASHGLLTNDDSVRLPLSIVLHQYESTLHTSEPRSVEYQSVMELRKNLSLGTVTEMSIAIRSVHRLKHAKITTSCDSQGTCVSVMDCGKFSIRMTIFASHAPVGRAVAGVDAICQRLIGAGRAGLSQSQLGSKLQRFMPAEQLSICLNIMHEQEMVQKFEVRDSKYGRPVALWRATKRMRQRGAQALVLREFERTLTEALVVADH
jgi:hypothetical protein